MAIHEPKLQITSADFKKFADYVTKNYPLNSFTFEEKEFVRKSLLINGICTQSNKLWVNIFADQLLDAMDEEILSSALGSSIQSLSVATCKAILGFYEIQHALRVEVARDQRTPSQHHMLEVHPNVMNFPVQLTIDIGRFFNLQKLSAEQVQVGKTTGEDTYQFQKLHNQLEETARLVTQQASEGCSSLMNIAKSISQEPEESSSGEATTSVEWHSRSAEDIFMRLCTFKVWHDKYEHEEEWNPKKMVNEWLQEAIQLYNNVSYHWQSCKIKKFPPETFPNIRHTCINNWLPDVADRAGVQPKGRKPVSNWIVDWATTPVMEKRMEWEAYFCGVISQAKNMAKLLGKHVVIPHFELEEPLTKKPARFGQSQVGIEPPMKKMKGENGQPITDHMAALEDMIRTIVQEEVKSVEKKISLLDRHGLERHYDQMRELGGHMNPMRTQLYHLSTNVNHMYHVLDRVNFTVSR